MLKQNARLIDLSIRILDLLILTFSLPIAHFLFRVAPMARADAPAIQQTWGPFVGILLLWIAAAGSGSVYGAYRRQTITSELARLFRTLSLVALGTIALLFAFDLSLPRLFLGIYFLSALSLLSLCRAFVRALARAVRRSGFNTRRVAIAGTGEDAADLFAAFNNNPQWGYQFAGFILPDAAAPSPSDGRVLGLLSDLEEILESSVLDEIVLTLPREHLGLLDPAVKICEEQGVRVSISVEPLRLASVPLSLFDFSGRPMLVFNRGPADLLSLGIKRTFDLAVSAVGLLVLSPILLATAAAVKFESKGPIFFKQTRVGLNGRKFSMIKFRSMFADAEERLNELRAQNEMSGPVFKMKNDPRITRVGRFIRKTSLDEFPQFWNVLCGDMSVVGPRPPLPTEVNQYERWQRRRLSVRPGITCTWQISGRNSISFERWMELDLEYIDNWSLRRDLQIFFQTIPAVLSARGAQ